MRHHRYAFQQKQVENKQFDTLQNSKRRSFIVAFQRLNSTNYKFSFACAHVFTLRHSYLTSSIFTPYAYNIIMFVL